MDLELQQAAVQEAQTEAQQQPENQQAAPEEPQNMQEAMFAQPVEGDAPEPEAAGETQDEAPPADDTPPPDAQPEEPADDLAEPEGLGEKASARFQALANEVKEYRAKDGQYRQMEETVQEFQRLAQESCNNGEEVAQLFDYAKAVKTGDFGTVEQYLKRQITQFEALSGRRLSTDLLAEYPDIRQRMDEMGLDEQSAQELAQARWQQQQQQAYMQQQREAQQTQVQQQQQAVQAQQQRQAVFDQAVRDVNDISLQYARTDVLWPEREPKVIAFAKTQLQQLPPEQWAFALQTFYEGLQKAANPVQQKVQPLRGSMPAGGQATPQSMEEAMFGGM